MYSRNLESHSPGIWMKREAQQILICQKQSMLGGRFCHCFPLPPPPLSRVLIHPAQRTNETCVTRQAAYLHYTWAASLEDNAVRDHFNCGGQKREMWIDRLSRQRQGRFFLPNCCAILDFLTICDIFISTLYANVLKELFLPISKGSTCVRGGQG